MVTARLLLEDSYRDQVPDQAAFSAKTLQRHRRLSSSRRPGGRQLPWPRALGTSPWAVAHELSHLTGRRYRTRVVLRRGIGEFESALRAVGPDTPVALYVGSRWLPRHVVLAVGRAEGALLVYEPSAGQLRRVHPGPWRWRRLGLAGWRRPWFVVLPDGADSR